MNDKMLVPVEKKKKIGIKKSRIAFEKKKNFQKKYIVLLLSPCI